MYFEVLLPAFARDVVTCADGGLDVVLGRTDRALSSTIESLPDAKRVVAFRE
jgi:hypothetical protein